MTSPFLLPTGSWHPWHLQQLLSKSPVSPCSSWLSLQTALITQGLAPTPPSAHCPLTSVRISAGTPVAMRMVQSCCSSPQWNMAFWQLLVAPGGFVGDTRTRTSYREANTAVWTEPGTFWNQTKLICGFTIKHNWFLKWRQWTESNLSHCYLWLLDFQFYTRRFFT